MAYNRVRVVISIEDSKQQPTTKAFELVTTDATQAEIDGAALVALFQPLCDGKILSYVVSGEITVVDSPEASSQRTDVMSITTQLSGRPEKGNMRLPCFPDDKSDANGVLLLADADVVAFQNAFIQATPGIAKMSDGEYIDGFVRGALK